MHKFTWFSEPSESLNYWHLALWARRSYCVLNYMNNSSSVFICMRWVYYSQPNRANQILLLIICSSTRFWVLSVLFAPLPSPGILPSPLKKKKKLFVWLSWVFVAAQAFPSCGEKGLLSSCGACVSHCPGFSCCRAQSLGTQGSGVVAFRLCGCGTWVVERRLSSCGEWA